MEEAGDFGNECYPEHLYIILEIAPNRRVSEVIGFLKGKSALAIFKKFPVMRRKYWGMHYGHPAIV